MRTLELELSPTGQVTCPSFLADSCANHVSFFIFHTVYGDALIEIEDQPTETCSNQGLERVAITSVLTFVSLPKHPMLDEDDIDVPMAW